MLSGVKHRIPTILGLDAVSKGEKEGRGQGAVLLGQDIKQGQGEVKTQRK